MSPDTSGPVSLSCALSTPDFIARKETVIARVRSVITETHSLPDGFRFVIPATEENFSQVLSFVISERQCCEFFSFQISVPSGSADLHLSITGPDGAKEFIRNEMGF